MVVQTEDGITPTEKGFERANQVWKAIADEDKFLLIPLLRKWLRLRFSSEPE